jgi:hypothetical protein
MNFLAMTSRDQAIWFLNSSDAGDDHASCELVWSMFIFLIKEKCDSTEIGTFVDELTAHRLLEFSKMPSTRNELRKFMDTHSEVRRISFAELLMYRFGYDVMSRHESGANRDAQDEMEKVKADIIKLTEVARNAALDAEVAHQSEARALGQELAASKAAEDARQAAKISDEAREKATRGIETLKLQEELSIRKREELENIASDDSKGVVSRNKAKAELAILLSEDQINLRAAKIHQEMAAKKIMAAAKKSEECVALSEAALERATHDRKEATRLKAIAIAATKAAEESIPSTQAAFDEISRTLDEVTKKETTGKGDLFFLEKESNQSRKYLPKTLVVT